MIELDPKGLDFEQQIVDKAILNAIITAEICLPSEDVLHTQHKSGKKL
jgi:hypothetical protein